MSTDSTELTFVRCPSCRSLVPAVSTRCRMCGAGIDAQGKESSASETIPPRRTRQNTITQPPTEFVQAVDASKASEVEAAAKPHIAVEADDSFDPLHDYLDDNAGDPPPAKIDVKEHVSETPQASPEPFVNEKEEEVEDDDFDIFSDDDDDWLDDLEDELPILNEEEAKQTSAPESKDMQQSPFMASEPESLPPEEPKKPDVTSNKVAPVTREQPRVVIESGARPSGKPSAFSFSKGKADDAIKRPAQEQSRGSGPVKSESTSGNSFARQQTVKAKDSRPQERGAQRTERPQQQRSHQAPRPEQKRDQPLDRQPSHVQGGQHSRNRQEHRPESQRGQQLQEQRVKAPVYEGIESRLVGWLVSFSTPTRSSHELREGKFFISGSSIKANDLVINDASVATPHAIVAVESGRLQVQDLMSDAGVFRRLAHESDFVAYAEPFELKHGDWVRFGNVDFQVTMIPLEHEE